MVKVTYFSINNVFLHSNILPYFNLIVILAYNILSYYLKILYAFGIFGGMQRIAVD